LEFLIQTREIPARRLKQKRSLAWAAVSDHDGRVTIFPEVPKRVCVPGKNLENKGRLKSEYRFLQKICDNEFISLSDAMSGRVGMTDPNPESHLGLRSLLSCGMW
jgi:hypothetical protein